MGQFLTETGAEIGCRSGGGRQLLIELLSFYPEQRATFDPPGVASPSDRSGCCESRVRKREVLVELELHRGTVEGLEQQPRWIH